MSLIFVESSFLTTGRRPEVVVDFPSGRRNIDNMSVSYFLVKDLGNDFSDYKFG